MLVHNAGIAGPPAGAAKTKDGLGVIYTTNFLGSFLMTNLLECNLSPAARVVCTSSTGHYSAVATLFPPPTPTAQPGTAAALALKSDSVAYGHSKAQQVLFVQLLQRHFSSLPDNRRTAHVFTPGFTSTPIFGKMNPGWETWLSDPLFAMLRITEKWFAVDTDEGAKDGRLACERRAGRGREVLGVDDAPHECSRLAAWEDGRGAVQESSPRRVDVVGEGQWRGLGGRDLRTGLNLLEDQAVHMFHIEILIQYNDFRLSRQETEASLR